METRPEDEAAVLAKCAEEPIRIPGAIQSHGYLFAVRTGTLVIEQLSENVGTLLGCEAGSLAGRSFLDLVMPGSEESLRNNVIEAKTNFVNPFQVVLAGPSGDPLEFEAIVNLIDGEVTIIELERITGEVARGDRLDDYFQLVQRTLGGSLRSHSMEETAGMMAEEIKRFTGFDRVMVYRFAEDGHGQVVAESKEPEMEPYLHLHYPASDVPPQARELYEENWVRLLRDVDSAPSPIIPQVNPRLGNPLDLSGTVLRAMSPIHLQYLRNMGVAATLTISLLSEGRLWGLIACHHRTPLFVPYGIRSASSLFGIVMSAQLEQLEKRALRHKHNEAEKEVAEALSKLDSFLPSADGLAPLLPSLMTAFEADGVALIEDGEVLHDGDVPSSETLHALQLAFEIHGAGEVVITNSAWERFEIPEKDHPKAAGVIAVCAGDARWIVLFRNEVRSERKWGGNPHATKADALGRLTPRASFAEWSEEIRGKAEPWPLWTEDLLGQLARGLTKFIVARERVLSERNVNLNNFASVVAHELKSLMQPSVLSLGMIRVLPDLDDKLRESVVLGEKALRELGSFADEMLEFARMSDSEDKYETVDLGELVDGAIRQIGNARGVEFRRGPLPQVSSLPSLLLQVFSNLLRNAVVHAKIPREPLLVEIGQEEDSDSRPVIFVRDNGRGIAPDDRDKIFNHRFQGGSGKRKGHGIGLAFVHQMLQQTGGAIWVESEPGEGACFYLRFPTRKVSGEAASDAAENQPV